MHADRGNDESRESAREALLSAHNLAFMRTAVHRIDLEQTLLKETSSSSTLSGFSRGERPQQSLQKEQATAFPCSAQSVVLAVWIIIGKLKIAESRLKKKLTFIWPIMGFSQQRT